MLYIPFQNDTELEAYFNGLYTPIKKAIALSGLDLSVKKYLSKSKVKKILLSKPKELIQLQLKLFKLIVPGFIQNEYFSIALIKNKRRYTPHEIRLKAKYDIIKILGTIFDYSKLISGNKEFAYKFAQLLNRSTCTYCNRLYTNTVYTKNPPKHGVIRPQFDHWYPKKIYPALALSFYNLIPSCSNCNLLKSDKVFSINDFFHPYIHDNPEDFTFSFYHKAIHKQNIKLNLSNSPKITSIVNSLMLDDIYNAHSESELKDLLELRFKYSENYIKTLLYDTFSNLEISKSEAYRFIFGIYDDEQNYHKRPFSKFKKDIIEELLKIK